MNKHIKQVLSLSAVLISGFLGNLFGSDYKIPLEGGYVLIRSNPSQHNIVEEKGVVVVPHDIKLYKIEKRYIIGMADLPDNKRFLIGARKGYFIINVASGNIEYGLSKNEWDKKIAAAGLTEIDMKEVIK